MDDYYTDAEMEYDDGADLDDWYSDADDLDAYADDDYQIDSMLDALAAEDDGEMDDLSERRGRRGRKRRRSARRGRQQAVRTASKQSSYRRPVPKRYVTHAEFKKTSDAQDHKIARNGSGIKSVNGRLNKLDSRVSDVVTVNSAQTTHIKKLNRQMRIDGALEFAESYDGAAIDVYQLLKGAVKSGMLDSQSGAFANPMVVGGLGFLLRNPAFLRQFFAPSGVITP